MRALAPALWVLLAAALGAEPPAQPPETEAPSPGPGTARAGWVATPASLVLYDSSGTVTAEIGLGLWEEPREEGLVRRRRALAGASSDGRFAWAWELSELVRPGRFDRVLESSRLMRYLGSSGVELWRDELADAPPGTDPVVISTDGETSLVAERSTESWSACAFNYTGNRLIEARLGGPVRAMGLSPRGAFAWVRWQILDKPPVYTILDLEPKISRDLPASKLPRGRARITDGGKLYDADELVLDLRPPPPAPP